MKVFNILLLLYSADEQGESGKSQSRSAYIH